MNEFEELSGLVESSKHWNAIVDFVKKWSPEDMDEIDEQVPPLLKKMWARMGVLSGRT